ncbi:ABC transporter ATP-binding protein [Mycolicibacterium chitae]|uniref:Branched-chain amino acid ABC transporter ATP-binding protein n=1 Tax=Mycolicibacterium chitae TaxID=1792 RepID=A0A448IDE1_MYCCI|nr:ATP-binding cassette domain-containing protein [Mycolicibacterium chitae]MCV7109117.1 ATP-binding cassette domain-containing protein [Mycolicibacterium chitae]BBZ01481.1 ABC transporter ATP-binding protein [Mycolicibacterium chitae]VEG50317.1 branched-chain amino acid ABC transporter ATP-binding protein [Mycolicibacterium chitae]
MLLEAKNLSTGYGPLTVVRDANLTVAAGEIVAIVGPNGAGKSSLMKCIARSLPVVGGSLTFQGNDLGAVPQNRIAELGIGFVPQQGNVFPELSVQENLQVSCRGSLSEARAITKEVLGQFPRLQERIKQAAATLSGGERQMLAIACALVSSPSLLMLDEPTTGLAPLIVAERIVDIQRLRDGGAGVLWIIEEHPRICLPAVDKVHFMSDGTLGPAMAATDLLEEGALEELFFGVAH